MFDKKCNVEALRQNFAGQTLEVQEKFDHRRGSGVSASSQTSEPTSSRRHDRATRASRTSQTEGSERKMKRIYPKVWTGCDTCKHRKIKCDEAKPECRNCTKSGRECLGYHPPQAIIFEPLAGISRSDSDMAHETRATEHFKNETAVRLASYRSLRLDLGFWQRVIPRLAVDSLPIRYAMLALSATQEEYESKASDLLPTEWSKSLHQHTRAVRELWSAIAEASISNEATLICCLLLTLYDVWHFGLPLSFTHIFGGFQHVFGGLKVCEFIKKTSAARSPLPETTDIDGVMMIPAFQYLADCALVLLDDTDDEQMMMLQEFAPTLNPIGPQHFAEIDEAVALMDRVLRQIAKLEAGCTDTSIDMMQEHLSSVFSALRASLGAAMAGNDAMATTEFRGLLVHHRAALILLNTVNAEYEIAFNEHLADFEFIVDEVGDLLSNGSAMCPRKIQIGMIPPLFLAATKCRDNLIRKRALTALHQVPHYEHLWTSCTAHQIAQQVVWLEESGANTRVQLQAITFDSTQRQVELRYSIQSIGRTRPESSAFRWEMGGDTENNDTPAPFSMPRMMFKMCGYSAPVLAY